MRRPFVANNPRSIVPTVWYHRTMLAPRDLPLVPVFVSVAKHGSFTAAARSLGLRKSVVSQHVRTLEERFGVRLFERTTRRLHLTQVGEQVLEAADGVLVAVKSLEQVVEDHRHAPKGTLRVTMPLDPALSENVCAVTAALLTQYPSLDVDLDFDDSVRDIVRDGFDVALRLGAIRESALVLRRLGREVEIILASPAVVAARSAIERPRDLRGVPWVVHTPQRERSAWTFHSEHGDGAEEAPVEAKVSVSTVIALRHLLLEGVGFGVLPRHVAHDDVRTGRLVRVCPGWIGRSVWLHALLPGRRMPPRVRVFLDQLARAAVVTGFDPP